MLQYADLRFENNIRAMTDFATRISSCQYSIQLTVSESVSFDAVVTMEDVTHQQKIHK